MRFIQVIHILLWNLLFETSLTTPTPVYGQSPLLREMEMKKSLFYYNKTPMQPPEMQKKSGQTPAQDKLYIKPYKFPFWGLPYGVYSKGGWFNPGLFPFVPGGNGFPPYDGVFGSPSGPGQFPGYPSNPFAQPSKPPPPATTTAAPTSPPTSPAPEHPSYDDSYEYYYVKRRPKKKRRPPPPPPEPKYKPPPSCHCPYSEDEDSDEDSDCSCSYNYYKPKDPPKPKPRPTYSSRPYRKPKKSSGDGGESSYYSYRRKPPSTSSPSYRKPCRYGYSSGPYGGCKSPPTRPPPKEDYDCGKRYRGRCPMKPKPEPSYYYPDEDEDPAYMPENEEEEEKESSDDEESSSSDTKVQYIPIYVPYPMPGSGYYPYPSGAEYSSPGYTPYSPPQSQYPPTPSPPSPSSTTESPKPQPQYQYAQYTPKQETPPQIVYPMSSASEPQPIMLHYTPIPQENTPQRPPSLQYMLQPAPSNNPDHSQYRSMSPPLPPITIQYNPEPQSYPSAQTQPIMYQNPNSYPDLATSASMNTFTFPTPQIQLPFQVLYKPPENGYLHKSESTYRLPLPKVTTTSSPKMNEEKNLRATNAEDPFIANHLNNYTATSLQMMHHNSSATAGTETDSKSSVVSVSKSVRES